MYLTIDDSQIFNSFYYKTQELFSHFFYQSKFSAPMKASWVKVSVEKVMSFHQQVNHSWPWTSTVSSIPHPTKRLLYFDEWVKSFLTWYIIWIHSIVTLFQTNFQFTSFTSTQTKKVLNVLRMNAKSFTFKIYRQKETIPTLFHFVENMVCDH